MDDSVSGEGSIQRDEPAPETVHEENEELSQAEISIETPELATSPSSPLETEPVAGTSSSVGQASGVIPGDALKPLESREPLPEAEEEPDLNVEEVVKYDGDTPESRRRRHVHFDPQVTIIAAPPDPDVEPPEPPQPPSTDEGALEADARRTRRRR